MSFTDYLYKKTPRIMVISENKLSQLIYNSIKSILSEEKSILINRKKWEYLDYENGERVLESTPKSIVICSNDCSIRLSAYKRYEHPDNMNPANGCYNKYWNYLGWEVNAVIYRNGHWETFDNSFPIKFKNKQEVLSFIQRTKSFNLAKKELNLI